MRKTDIYEIAIKIVGVYLLVEIIQQIVQYITLIFTALTFKEQDNNFIGDQVIGFGIGIGGLLLTIIVAWVMIFRTKYVVRKISSQSDFEENAQLFATQKVIYEIAIIVMGLILIVWAAPDFIFKFSNYVQMLKSKQGESFRTVDKNYMILSIVKIIVGIFTILLARQISTYFARKEEKNISKSGDSAPS